MAITLRTALAVVVFAAPICAEQAGNLIRNHGFEQASAGRPEGWVLTGHGNVSELGLGEGVVGKRAAKLSCTRFIKGWVILAQDGVVKVRKKQWYRLTFRCRGEALRTVAGVALFNRKPWVNCGLTRGFDVSPKWTQHDIRFQSMRDATDTRFEFYFSSTGTLLLDDVKIVACGPPPLVGVLPPRATGNHVLNGSFELAGYRWGTEGRDSLAAQPVAGGPCGQTCLRIRVDPATADEYAVDCFEPRFWKVYGSTIGTATWTALHAGRPVVLSAYLRSGREPVKARLSIGTRRNRVVEVGSEWKRYEVSAKPSPNGSFVNIGIALGRDPQPCELYVDGVQLEHADKATSFAPRESIEVALTTERYGGIYMVDEMPTAQLGLHATERTGVKVLVAVTDCWDKVVQQQTLDMACPAGETVRRQVELRGLPKGFFRLTATILGRSDVTPAKLRLAKVEPLHKLHAGADGPFGINHASPALSRLPLMRMAGITWVRDWTIKWHQVQASDGAPFDFTMGDRLIDRWVAHGFKVMCVLPYPGTPWCTTAPADSPRTGGGRPFYRTLSYMPADVGKFGDYVHATVAHFKDRVKVWEILNEPSRMAPQNYAKLLRVAHARAKEADPTCRVVGGYSAAPDTAFGKYEPLFKLGALGHMDIVNLHPYPNARSGHSYIAGLNKFNACMDANGGRVPIWNTEYLYCSDDDPLPTVRLDNKPAGACRSEIEAVNRMVQYNVTFLALGTEKLFQHTNHWPLRLTRDTLLFSMFFDYAAAPKKAFAAHGAMAWLLGPAPKPVKLMVRDSRYCALFETERGTLAVVWQDRWAGERGISVPDGAAAYDMMGNRVKRQPLELSESPVYLLSPRSAEAVARAVADALGS